MDRVFLDANVLFSAAYSRNPGLRALWRHRNALLLTSAYAAEEARRNLDTSSQMAELHRLLTTMTVVAASPPEFTLPAEAARLHPKDAPILRDAISAGATHLITGDFSHFGRYYGRRIGGVLIQSPADFLRDKNM